MHGINRFFFGFFIIRGYYFLPFLRVSKMANIHNMAMFIIIFFACSVMLRQKSEPADKATITVGVPTKLGSQPEDVLGFLDMMETLHDTFLQNS